MAEAEKYCNVAPLRGLFFYGFLGVKNDKFVGMMLLC